VRKLCELFSNASQILCDIIKKATDSDESVAFSILKFVRLVTGNLQPVARHLSDAGSGTHELYRPAKYDY